PALFPSEGEREDRRQSLRKGSVGEQNRTNKSVSVPREERESGGLDFEEIDVAPPGGAIEQPWLSAADIDGDGKPELLLTQKNYVRAVVLKSDASFQNVTNRSGWTFAVKDQINGTASNSRLVAAAAIPNG